MSDNKNITVHSGMSWIGWFIILFWNFNDDMDLYDAIILYLTR